MKTYLTALISFLIALTAPAFALAALDVSMSGSSVITVGGINLTVNDTATLDYINVGSDSFDVRLSPGSTIKVSSSDRKALTVTPTTGYTSASTCTSDSSSITLDMPSTHPGPYIVLTVTPSSSACDASSGGGSPGATSGGGGGGGGSVPTPVYTVIPGTASSVSSVSSAASSAVAIAQAPSTISTPSTTSTSPGLRGASITITKSLKVGSQNSEVRALQQALAQDKTIYPEGLATGYYGPATQRAIVRFQKKYGIDPVGFVGPATRKKLNEVYGQATTQETPSTVSTPSTTSTSPGLRGASITITKSLKLGSQDNEVKALQQALAQDKTIYPEGLATGYYGPATQRAIVRFQKKYGIDPVGFVGPQTRKKLNEVYGPSANPQ